MATDKRGRKLPKGIQQRYDKFEGRVQYQGKRYLVHGESITETQRAMNELRYKLSHGLFVENGKITLSEWFETWIEQYKKDRIKAGTYYNYRKYFDIMVKEKLGNKRLSDIRGEHIQKFYNELIKQGYAVSSIKIVSAVLNGCMQQALRNGLIERNPVKLTEPPKKQDREKRQAMTKEQQVLFMGYAKESYLYNLFAVMLRTGLRSGEIRGLKYADIDKKRNVICVERTIKYYEGQGYFEDTPKTRTSKREIPLTQDLITLLDNQKDYWDFKVERLDRYLFCNEKGEVLSRDRLTSEIKRIVNRIRSDRYDFPDITAHVFRHTFATRAIEAGMPPQVLKTILGHSSLSMTMDLYSHVLPNTKAAEMEKIAEAF